MALPSSLGYRRDGRGCGEGGSCCLGIGDDWKSKWKHQTFRTEFLYYLYKFFTVTVHQMCQKQPGMECKQDRESYQIKNMFRETGLISKRILNNHRSL